MKTSRSILRATSAVVGVLLALTLAGCSGSGDGEASDSSASGGDSTMEMAEPAAAEAPMDGKTESEFLADESASGDSGSGDRSVSSDLTGQTRAVIATGTMTLRADDLAAARVSVRKVLDTYRGEIAEEETETDGKGELVFARIVLRIPSASFVAAMDDLEAISKYNTRTTGAEDVTTQVIDIEARVRAQTKSLARIEALLAEATTFKDVVAIESQLTSRQAELESLKAQQSWLNDQTSMSTVTVYLEQLSGEAPPKDDDTGFLAGIRAGWHALGSATVGFATVLGAVLPFALVLAVIGYPLWLLTRRAGRHFAGPHFPGPHFPGRQTSPVASQDSTE